MNPNCGEFLSLLSGFAHKVDEEARFPLLGQGGVAARSKNVARNLWEVSLVSMLMNPAALVEAAKHGGFSNDRHSDSI